MDLKPMESTGIPNSLYIKWIIKGYDQEELGCHMLIKHYFHGIIAGIIDGVIKICRLT